MSGLATLLLIFSLGLTESPTQNEGKGEFEKCASMPEDAARLACFDAYTARVRKQNSASLKAAKSQADKATQPKEEQRQNDFSLSIADRARREAQIEKQETQSSDPESMPAKSEKTVPESVVARVKTFTRLNRSNKIRITLDNGQVWQEIDGAPFHGNVEPGAEVTITKRRFGGYRMKVPGRSSAIFVRRIK